MSLSINIPEEHYVTFHFRDNDIYPLGFLVPEGKDKAAQQRKSTADRWANGSKVKVPAKVFTNKPMVGFEIRKSVRYRGLNSTRETWRIIDPRGFELEITNSNMEFIIDHCILDKGEIISSCIWGRDGTVNLLLPVDSKEYKDAIANTERQGKKASMKEVRIGDHVTFKKGNKARFLGKYYKHRIELGSQFESANTIEMYSTKSYVFLENNDLVITSSAQVSEIDKSESITDSAAEELVNQIINTKNAKYRYSDSPVILSAEKIDFTQFVVNYSKLYDMEQVLKNGYYHAIITSKTTGTKYIVDAKYNGYSYNKDTVTAVEIKLDDLKENLITYIQVPSSRSYGGNEMTPKRINIDAKTLASNYDIEVMSFGYTTSLGTEVSVKI